MITPIWHKPMLSRASGRIFLFSAFLLSLFLINVPRTFAASNAVDGADYNMPFQVVAGENLTLTYTYLNDRPWGDFSEIKLVAKIPTGTTFVSGGEFNSTTGEVTVAFGALKKNETATFRYAVNVPQSLANTTIKSENAAFQITIPAFGSATSRLNFTHEIRVISQRVESTVTPTATPSLTPPVTPSVTPSSTPSTTPSATPSAEVKLMARTLHAGVVSPGETMTYTFKIANEGTIAVSQLIDLEVTLPTGVVYKSGGTYNNAQNNATFPNINNFAPGEVKFFTLAVEVPGGTALNTNIAAPTISAWYPVGGGSLRSIPGVIPGVTNVTAVGTVLATYRNAQGTAFDPMIHGYGFQNYGAHPGGNDDLSPADAFDLFGPQVCQNSGATRANCQLSAAGTQWVKGQLAGMSGGHCEGMAVTAQRFFEQLSFNGKIAPADFQTGRANVYDLAFPEQNVENYIASYFVRQTFSEVSTEAWQSRNTMTPGQIVDKLIEEFNKTPSVGYALGFYKPDYSGGHAVTPYAIERVGSSQVYRIAVYDNNFPGQKRYVTVDKATNKWHYVAAADPSRPASLYEGDANTKTLEINRISLRDMPTGQYFACAFCKTGSQTAVAQNASSVDGVAQDTNESIEVSFSGEGKILIVDDQERRVGYDFDTLTEVNEITGTTVMPLKLGLGKEIPPVYQLDGIIAEDALYQIYVGGTLTDTTTNGDLYVTGEDFVMGVEEIILDAGDMYRFDISPLGNEIYFEATTDTIAPSLFMAFEPSDEDAPGLIIEIDGMLLKAGEIVYIGVDTENGRVSFLSTKENNVELARPFYLDVTAIWPNGEETTNTIDVTLPSNAKVAYLDYANWEQGGQPRIVVEGNLYLPSVQR